MPDILDVLVIGAGPNGLVAANHLADRGWSVRVLEAAPEPGGTVRGGELTAAGFNHDPLSAFCPWPSHPPAIRRLGLEDFGLRWCQSPLVLAHPLPDGRCTVLSTDLEATASALDGFTAGDGAAWTRMTRDWDLIAEPLLAALLGRSRAAARVMLRLGATRTLRLPRHALLPVRRMAEEMFRGEAAGLLVGGSALHTDVCPEAAGSGLYGSLLCCLGQRFGFRYRRAAPGPSPPLSFAAHRSTGVSWSASHRSPRSCGRRPPGGGGWRWGLSRTGCSPGCSRRGCAAGSQPAFGLVRIRRMGRRVSCGFGVVGSFGLGAVAYGFGVR